MKDFHQLLFEKHDIFKDNSFTKRRFKHKDILPIIQKLPFQKMMVGNSFEDREIVKITIGEGKRTILLWSQMHGNEATATMACFDIFRFFQAKNDEFDVYRNEILSALNMHFIPMINPDGTERFIRRTAQGIDMNRDAIALQCPESKILKENVGKLKPEFSFNLHDQGVRYSAGLSPKQATVSFLATAYNEQREWNEVRTKSRQVISQMNEVLQNYLPGGVGRFSDEFEPRAFGDNIQKWGSSLILVESGGYPKDTEKQYIRKLNFVAILGALLSIARNSYTNYTLENYESIPQNEKNHFDLKITNLKTKTNNQEYLIDLGINSEEKNNKTATDFTISSVIEDLGDLSVFSGIEILDAKGGMLKSFEAYPALIIKHKLGKKYPVKLEIGVPASFVIDHGKTLTLVINGKIIID
jgi:Zinc carboxypeptidase